MLKICLFYKAIFDIFGQRRTPANYEMAERVGFEPTCRD